jgi:hypothetical protein
LPAHKAGHIGGHGLGVDILGRGRLLDVTVIHDHHQVGKRDRFRLGMGHVDKGDAEIALHASKLATHLQSQELVQRR